MAGSSGKNLKNIFGILKQMLLKLLEFGDLGDNFRMNWRQLYYNYFNIWLRILQKLEHYKSDLRLTIFILQFI